MSKPRSGSATDKPAMTPDAVAALTSAGVSRREFLKGSGALARDSSGEQAENHLDPGHGAAEPPRLLCISTQSELALMTRRDVAA